MTFDLEKFKAICSRLGFVIKEQTEDLITVQSYGLKFTIEHIQEFLDCGAEVKLSENKLICFKKTRH